MATLRKSANQKQAISKSLGNVASNKGMKKSDGKATYQVARKNVDVAKKAYRLSGDYESEGNKKRYEQAKQRASKLSKYNKGNRIAKRK